MIFRVVDMLAYYILKLIQELRHCLFIFSDRIQFGLARKYLGSQLAQNICSLQRFLTTATIDIGGDIYHPPLKDSHQCAYSGLSVNIDRSPSDQLGSEVPDQFLLLNGGIMVGQMGSDSSIRYVFALALQQTVATCDVAALLKIIFDFSPVLRETQLAVRADYGGGGALLRKRC
jgi:hypothetical protein